MRRSAGCEPLEDVPVQVWLATETGGEQDNRAVVRTDEDGRYRIETPPTVPQFGEPNIHVGVDPEELGFEPVFIRRVVDLDDERAVVEPHARAPMTRPARRRARRRLRRAARRAGARQRPPGAASRGCWSRSTTCAALAVGRARGAAAARRPRRPQRPRPPRARRRDRRAGARARGDAARPRARRRAVRDVARRADPRTDGAHRHHRAARRRGARRRRAPAARLADDVAGEHAYLACRVVLDRHAVPTTRWMAWTTASGRGARGAGGGRIDARRRVLRDRPTRHVRVDRAARRGQDRVGAARLRRPRALATCAVSPCATRQPSRLASTRTQERAARARPTEPHAVQRREEALDEPPHAREGRRRQPRGDVARPCAGTGAAATPSFAAGSPAIWNSRWSEIPRAATRRATTPTRRPVPARGAQTRALDAARGATPTSAAPSAARARPRRATARAAGRRARPRRRTRRTSASAPRWSGRAGVDPLLRARSRRARRRSAAHAPQPRRERVERRRRPRRCPPRPGVPATVSVCAMTTYRHDAGVS